MLRSPSSSVKTKSCLNDRTAVNYDEESQICGHTRLKSSPSKCDFTILMWSRGRGTLEIFMMRRKRPQGHNFGRKSLVY